MIAKYDVELLGRSDINKRMFVYFLILRSQACFSFSFVLSFFLCEPGRLTHGISSYAKE